MARADLAKKTLAAATSQLDEQSSKVQYLKKSVDELAFKMTAAEESVVKTTNELRVLFECLFSICRMGDLISVYFLFVEWVICYL